MIVDFPTPEGPTKHPVLPSVSNSLSWLRPAPLFALRAMIGVSFATALAYFNMPVRFLQMSLLLKMTTGFEPDAEACAR